MSPSAGLCLQVPFWKQGESQSMQVQGGEAGLLGAEHSTGLRERQVPGPGSLLVARGTAR